MHAHVGGEKKMNTNKGSIKAKGQTIMPAASS